MGSFWFAAFGAGESTSLRIYRQGTEEHGQGGREDSEQPSLWELSAAELNTDRPEWQPGQVFVDMQTIKHLVLEGKASNGGFTIDQLTFPPGDCTIRPASASPELVPRA